MNRSLIMGSHRDRKGNRYLAPGECVLPVPLWHWPRRLLCTYARHELPRRTHSASRRQSPRHVTGTALTRMLSTALSCSRLGDMDPGVRSQLLPTKGHPPPSLSSFPPRKERKAEKRKKKGKKKKRKRKEKKRTEQNRIQRKQTACVHGAKADA